MPAVAMERELGAPLHFMPAGRPQRSELRGQHVLLRPVVAEDDAEPLFAESHPPLADPGLWTYMPGGPYADVADLGAALAGMGRSEDPLFFTLAKLPGEHPTGIASYLRITPEHGVIEIGYIWFGATLQRTTAASEAIYLLASNAFDELGYRRLEWKCDSLNVPSRRAAKRFGFRFEGVFRNHMVIKGRNRDTAWYAITDDEWPAIRGAFRAWLAPENQDGSGHQRRRLGDLIAEARAEPVAGGGAPV
jgi:RimJ/RimL family protein N-acetyltransferase